MNYQDYLKHEDVLNLRIFEMVQFGVEDLQIVGLGYDHTWREVRGAQMKILSRAHRCSPQTLA